MFVKYLLEGVQYKVVQGTDEMDVDSISWDSRKAQKNSLFICVRGKKVDRHDFAAEAVQAGASVLVVDHEICRISMDTTIIKVQDTKEAMAHIASVYFDSPSKSMNVIGITGTNGKTSVSWYIAKILETAGRKTGIIGTIENRVGDSKVKVEKLNPTTPDSIELQATLLEMLDEGVTDIAMEVTSAALVNHRVDQCHFKIGVFTNLTQDHLDEHGTMENYKNAKLKLFKMCRYGIVNADDRIFSEIEESAACEKLTTYGIHNKADIMAENIQYTINGSRFTLSFMGTYKNIHINAPGKFSVYNTLAAIGACYASGLTLNEILNGLENMEGVRGRFEAVPNPKGCLIVIDYAHTPDGLDNILSSVRELAKSKVIIVFGCGGDRDRGKRPMMGEIAGKWADLCILTSDNPRSEDPAAILDDIEQGISKTGCFYEKIVDRRAAIIKALDAAQPEDVVILAGKGHETYQKFANRSIHFDDKEIVKEYFEKVII